MQTHSQRPGANVQHPRGVRVAQTLPRGQQKNLPVALTKSRKRRRNDTVAHLRDITDSTGDASHQAIMHRCSTRLTPPPVGKHPPRDTKQPRPRILRQIINPAPRDQEHLRHRIIGIVQAGTTRRIHAHRSGVISKQSLEPDP